MNKFYLTTAIDYPNAKPHIGTAFEKVGADVMYRYRRWRGDDAFFLMGNDENTWKVAKRAIELGEDPKSYCDRMASEFKVAWTKLHIFPDRFIQTTDADHIEGVKVFLEAVKKSGMLYKKSYQGFYCDGCEAFKTHKEINNGCCPDHPTQELRKVEEENWFFKLSEYRTKLLDMYQRGILKIEPQSRYNEVSSFVDNDLQDISISRRNEGWGIPIPWDNTQVVYVWFDALLNYLTGIGFGTDWAKFNKWWPADIHFIGKDITRFHCALFPAMIMAYNANGNPIDLPRRVFAHGFVYKRQGNELIKESKTLGNATDPVEIAKQIGTDAYRYYFMSKCAYGNDGEYSLDHLVEVFNSDLANNLGNLVSRVVAMTQRYFNGRCLEDFSTKTDDTFVDFHKRYVEAMDEIRFNDALTAVWDIMRLANAYIDEQKPWELFKTDPVACSQVLQKLIVEIQTISLYLKPFMPMAAEMIYGSFTGGVPWKETSWSYLEKIVTPGSEGVYSKLGINDSCLVEGKYPPLFQRIEVEK